MPAYGGAFRADNDLALRLERLCSLELNQLFFKFVDRLTVAILATLGM